MGFMTHKDERVRQAIVNLCDVLCEYERATGVESILRIDEKPYDFPRAGDTFTLMALSGKPVDTSKHIEVLCSMLDNNKNNPQERLEDEG